MVVASQFDMKLLCFLNQIFAFVTTAPNFMLISSINIDNYDRS